MPAVLLRIFFFFIFPVLLLFLALNKHSREEGVWYRQVIFADAAGYYVYLPHWFISKDDPAFYNDSLIRHRGEGFVIDERGKLKTKYSCGVAILQAPFFLAAHAMAPSFGYERDGFSRIYQQAVMIAALVYAWLGCLFIFLLLRKKYSPWISYTVPIVLFFATNLYWYAIDASGMSHAYSFFLISFFLFLTSVLPERPSFLTYLLLFLTLFLIFLIRPTNAIVGLMLLFYDANTFGQFAERVRFYFRQLGHVVPAALLSLVVFIPQLLYWEYYSGEYFYYSYGQETFAYLGSPRLLEVLFSARNGLFIYTPVMVLFIGGLIWMIRKKYAGAWGPMIIFLLAWYLFSSWWNWYFGCAYGARSFIDLYPVFAVGLAFLLARAQKRWRIIFLSLAGICVLLNLDAIYYYDGCFYGGPWEFGKWFELFL